MPGARSRLRAGALLVVALAVLSSIAACGRSDRSIGSVPTFGTAIPPDVNALTDDTSNPLAFPAYGDPNVPIVVGVGKRFAVMLPADPSTGYRWELAAPLDTAVIGSIGSQFLPANTALPGAPDSEILSYVANGVGATKLQLRYSAASGQPGPDDKTATFDVTVTLDGQPPPPPETTTTTVFGAKPR